MIFTLAYKELKGYFVAPVAYVVIAAFLLFSGWFFVNLVNNFNMVIQNYEMYAQMMRRPDFLEMLERVNLNEWVVTPLLSNLTVIFLFVTPLVTMRLFAEEKKAGTDELLLTSPLTTNQIVLGKYLGAVSFLAIVIFLSSLSMLVLLKFGDPEIPQILVGYLGLFLVACVFLGIGLFTSTLTENQIVAAVLCFITALILYIINWPAASLESTSPVLSKVLSYLSVTDHFSNFAKGLIDTTDVIYFLSLVVLSLFLTKRSLESLKWR